MLFDGYEVLTFLTCRPAAGEEEEDKEEEEESSGRAEDALSFGGFRSSLRLSTSRAGGRCREKEFSLLVDFGRSGW